MVAALHFVRYLPPLVKTCTRAFPVSVTTTRPRLSMATSRGSLNDPFALPSRPQRADEPAPGVEHLNAVVTAIDDVDTPLGIDGNATRVGKFAMDAAAPAPGANEPAAPVENLDAVVRRVGHVDASGTSHGHTPRIGEPPVRRAMAAEPPHKPATGGEHLDAVIECIGDDDLARRVDGDTPRPVELTVALAESAPGASKGAGTGELLDAIVVRVGDVDTAAGDGDSPRTIEPASRRTAATPAAGERVAWNRGENPFRSGCEPKR